MDNHENDIDENKLSKNEERLSAEGSTRRRLLEMLLALGFTAPAAMRSESREKAKSLLPDNLEINSAVDLERLLEAILPAVHEDFANQDRATEKLRQQSGNANAKAAPVNGETFLVSVQDFAQRIERMIQTRRVMERMDQIFDARLEQAEQEYRAHPTSMNAVRRWVRACQRIDLFATKPVIYKIKDFWNRIDEFDRAIGPKSNRVPVTSQDSDARSDDRKAVEYLIKIIKGHEAVQEYIRNFHAKNPSVYGERALGLSMEVGEPFQFDHKVHSMVSLRDSTPH